MKISEKVEMIDGSMANCYVIHQDDKILLIDAGTKSTGRKIVNYFRQSGNKPDTVLITHYHPDHIGGLRMIYDEFKPQIYAPRVEIPVLTGKEKIEPTKSFLSKMVAGMSRIDPVEDVKESEGLQLPFIDVIPSPGHTPGSTSYLFKPENILFVGDAFSVSSGEAKINKSFTADIPAAERSKEKLLSMKGVTVLPGHGSSMHL